MSGQLKHIFDLSTCPTKRQMLEYLDGVMQPEEIYAFEHHISSCILCNEAVDGMMEHEEAALEGMRELSDVFLKDHLELHPPHIHLNGIAATAATVTEGEKAKSINVWKPAGIAAALLLCLGIGWYFKSRPLQLTKRTPVIAQAKEENKESQPVLNPDEKDRPPTPSAVHQLAASPATSSVSAHPPATISENAEQTVPSPNNEAATSASPIAAIEKSGNFITEKKTDSQQESAKKELNNFNIQNADEGVTSSGGASRQETKIAVTDKAAISGTSSIAKAPLTATRKQEKNAAATDISEANTLYENGEYALALTAYKKQMNDSDGKNSQQARLMAARCYLNLGQKKNALKLLSELYEEGSGSAKRQAKKLIRELKEEE